MIGLASNMAHSQAVRALLSAQLAETELIILPNVEVHSTGPDIELCDNERFSGAAIAGSRLAIATITGSPEDWALDRPASTLIELGGRDQYSVHLFRRMVEHFCGQHAITRCTLRAPQERGPYAARGFAFKIETALQFSSQLIVDLAAPASVKMGEPWAAEILETHAAWPDRANKDVGRYAVAAALHAARQGSCLDIEEVADA